MHSKREKGTDPKAQFDIVPTLYTQSLFQYIMILFKQTIYLHLLYMCNILLFCKQ